MLADMVASSIVSSRSSYRLVGAYTYTRLPTGTRLTGEKSRAKPKKTQCIMIAAGFYLDKRGRGVCVRRALSWQRGSPSWPKTSLSPQPTTAAMARVRVIAVMRFDDRNRFGNNGIPASLLFSGGRQCVVRMKEKTLFAAGRRNRFAKIELDEDGGTEAALIELLGNVGEYEAELQAYQLHFGVKPCRYPPDGR
jgi:hypothetical protein